MYYITGTVKRLEKDGPRPVAVVDAAGTGYQIRLTKRLAKSLVVGKEDEILVLQINFHNKEPIFFGFASAKERCLFSVFVEQSMLAVEDAFKVVSDGGDDLIQMLRTQDFDGLQGLGMSESEAVNLCIRMQYQQWDVAQNDIMNGPTPRKIVSMDEERNKQAMEALFDADGNSLVDQGIVSVKALCQLQNMKPKQAQPLVEQAMCELHANKETSVQEIILRANELAKGVNA
jgi:Holliday junction resolvasome RuvABC DNA-binding subunit